MKPAIVGYVRYSDPSQGEGSSEARQEKGFAAFVKYHPECNRWKEVYCDRGKSGYSGKHLEHDFGRLLADAQAKKFPKNSIIYFEDMDRFGRRKVAPSLADFQKILDCGYRIGVENSIYSSDTDEMDLMKVIFKIILAYEESKKKAKRVKDSWEDRRTKDEKLTEQGPLWLKLSADRKSFEEKPWAVKTVKMIFGWAEDGLGIGRICKKLNQLKVRVLREPGHKRHRDEWQPSYISKILRSRTVLGEYQPCSGRKPCGPVKPYYYKRIIKEAQFIRVQAALTARKNQRGPTGEHIRNLFTGLIFSAVDGGVMRVVDKGDTDGGTRLVSAKSERQGTPMNSFPYEPVEKSILYFLKELSTADFEPHKEDEDEEQEERTLKIGRLERSIQEILAEMDDPNSQVGFLAQKVKSYQKQLDTLKATDDEAKQQHSTSQGDTLTEVQDLALALEKLKLKKNELVDLRSKIRSKLPQLIEKIDIVVAGGRANKCCIVRLSLVNGDDRFIFAMSGVSWAISAPTFKKLWTPDRPMKESDVPWSVFEKAKPLLVWDGKKFAAYLKKNNLGSEEAIAHLER